MQKLANKWFSAFYKSQQQNERRRRQLVNCTQLGPQVFLFFLRLRRYSSPDRFHGASDEQEQQDQNSYHNKSEDSDDVDDVVLEEVQIAAVVV